MSHIEDLIKVLKSEEEIYSKILKVSNKKTEMIADENIEEIEKISKQEEEYIKQARLLEYKREDYITAIEKSLNIEKISDISSLLNYVKDEDLKKELKDTQIDFNNTLGELKKVNLINNTLIKDALEYIDLSLNLVTDATAENTYNKDSASKEPQIQHKNMFDFKG